MKLASLKNGSRDGRLVIVSRDLTRFTDASFLVPTLQAALDDWRRIAPHLAALSESLDHGAVPSERFHEHDALSPLPRAYQRLHASPSRNGSGLMLEQGASDAFAAPREPLALADEGWRIAANGEVAVVTDDVATGAGADEARDAIRLLMVGNDMSLKAGGLQSRLASAFSPVAVTPDELGDAWDGAKLALPLTLTTNGRPPVTGDAVGDFATMIAQAAAFRRLAAGTIIGVRAPDATAAMAPGDTVRIEVKDRKGHSIFGAIEQTAERVQHDG